MLINPEGSPFYIFRHYATFFERKKLSKISADEVEEVDLGRSESSNSPPFEFSQILQLNVC